MKLPVIKCSISQAINELNLISHISAVEACYLGGHYGRMISASWYVDGGLKKANNVVSFLMKSKAGRCQILYKDRSGDIGYYDKKLQQEFITSPLSIVNNEKLISLFNSSQACYIGILAGLQFGKKNLPRNVVDESNHFTEKKSHLKLVK